MTFIHRGRRSGLHRTRLIPSLGLGLGILASGCGGSDDRSDMTSRAAQQTKDTRTVQLPAGRIAFRRFFDDAQTHGAVFTINTDGTGETQLTDPPEGTIDNYPDWSPDGRLIAFERCGEGKPCSVWTVDDDDGPPHKLRVHCRLKGDCDASGPAWTPDGRLVVTLAQGRERILGGAPQIQRSALELVDPRTGKQRTILKRTGWSGDLINPAVSPDGRKLLYTRWNAARGKPSLGQALFVVDMDGRHNHQVAPWELGGGDHAVFSPEGSILFRSFAEDESRQSDFWTVRPDGSDLRQLTHFEEGTLVRSASYSPDGAWIVHASDGIGGNADLFVMHADGTGNQPLTRTEPWDSAPDWGPPSP
jgi:TolB protein